MRHPIQGDRQHGYSIVEIGIVLVALSFMVTGALWGFSQQSHNERNDSTREYMQTLEDAVVNYAYANRTPGLEFTYLVTITSTQPALSIVNTVTVQIGSGRPILPCPDIDGDGYEDRSGTRAQVPGLSVDSFGLNIRVVDLTLIRSNCVDNKGIFPYLTLRTKPADPWGNHFTYWVDANNFAHGRFGFDQTSRGSPIFPHLAINRGNNLGSPGADYALDFAFISGSLQGLTGQNQGSAGRNFANGYVLERIIDPASPACADNCDYVLVAGEPIEPLATETGNTGVDLRKTIFQGDLIRATDRQIYTTRYTGDNVYPMKNGIAFAIVSHGANGHGAVVHLNDNETRAEFLCLPESEDEGELINARRTNSCQVKDRPVPNNCTTIQNFSNNCQESNRFNRGNGIFVSGTRANGSFSADSREQVIFDDIVTWMHPTELITKLTRLGALPQERPLLGVIPQ